MDLALTSRPLIDISIARVNPSYLKIQLNFILPYLQVIILARIISSWQDLDLRFKTQCSSKSFCKVTTQWVCLIIQNLKKECHPVQDLSSSYATFWILIHNQDDFEGCLDHSFLLWPDFNISSRYTLRTQFYFYSIYSSHERLVRKVISIRVPSKVTFYLSRFLPIR